MYHNAASCQNNITGYSGIGQSHRNIYWEDNKENSNMIIQTEQKFNIINSMLAVDDLFQI